MGKQSIQIQLGTAVASVMLALCGCGSDTGSSGETGSSGSESSGGSTGATSSPTTGEAPTTGGASSGGSETGGEEHVFCEQQHVETIDGRSVVICDVAFADPPFVHLPEQKALGAGHVEAYFALRGEGFVNGAETHPFAGTPAQLEAEAVRHAFAIYRTELDEMGFVVAADPGVYIDERNFLRALEGRTMEGKISRQTGDNFELTPTLPIRVTFGTAAVFDDTTPGMTRYSVALVVDNLTGGVKAEDGTCLASMDSHGVENPFTTYPSALVFSRVASMHDLFDDVATVAYTDSASVMSASLYLDPLDFILPESSPPAPYTGDGHGTPGSIPNLYVQLSASGGEACTP